MRAKVSKILLPNLVHFVWVDRAITQLVWRITGTTSPRSVTTIPSASCRLTCPLTTLQTTLLPGSRG